MASRQLREHAPHVGLRCSELGRVKAVIIAIKLRGRLDIMINNYPAFLFASENTFHQNVAPKEEVTRLQALGFNATITLIVAV